MKAVFVLLLSFAAVNMVPQSDEERASTVDHSDYIKTRPALRASMEGGNFDFTWTEFEFEGLEVVVTDSTYLGISNPKNGIDGWAWRPRHDRWERIFQVHVRNCRDIRIRLTEDGKIEAIGDIASTEGAEIFAFHLKAAE